MYQVRERMDRAVLDNSVPSELALDCRAAYAIRAEWIGDTDR